MRTRVQVLLRAFRRRGFVLLSDVPSAPPLPQGPTTPGTVVFAPEFTLDWPVWSASVNGGSAGRSQLPLPEELKQRIDDWARRWNRVMYDNAYEWPDDASVRAALDEEARTLVADMQTALGPQWRVEYGGVDA